MKRQYQYFIVFLCFLILACCVYDVVARSKNAPTKNTRPHIVIMLIDDMGRNDVSFNGADEIPTPNIDALAYNGVILNRHYVLPICTPSRTSLLTGRYALREGMQGWPMRAGELRSIPLTTTLMPEYFQNLGYRTKLVGKWHLGYYTDDHTPARRGFDKFFGYYNGLITYFDHWITEVTLNGTVVKGFDLHEDGPTYLTAISQPKYFTDLITDEAERIIRNNGNSKPLFLEIAHLGVHASANDDDPLEVRNLTEVNESFNYIKDPQRRKYAGMIQALDQSVGRVVKALGEADMLENSIILLMSDNGAPTFGLYSNTGSNYPLRGIKGTLYEGGVRGAACIFSPLINTPSRVSNQPIHITDWLPTLYSAAGGDLSDFKNEIDGFNQWPSLVYGIESPRQSMVLNIDEKTGNEAAINGRFKILKAANESEGGFYGSSGNDPSFPSYNVEDAFTSAAGSAISQLNNFVSPSMEKAQKMREKSIIRCKPTENRANCTERCLFDIYNDPCEISDLSEYYPEVTENLELMLSMYREVLMLQTNTPMDPCSDPRYFNGTWMPWRTDDVLLTPLSNRCQLPDYGIFAQK